MGDYIVLIISCIFVNNILLAQFLGNCPFLGTSKKMETALGMARELNALPPLAVRWTKLSVNKWLKHQLNLILDASIAYEMLSINSKDHHEAARAFIEKRPPVFKGV